MQTKIEIRKGTIDEVVDISGNIPEFDSPHGPDTYDKRLKNKDSLILIASVNGIPAGFKVGYDKFEDGSFYTWMGAVLPDYRQLGLAKLLAAKQEEYATNKNYDRIILKTRNRHKNMLIFAIKSGFNVIEVITKEDISENRIVLEKKLANR